MGAVKNNSSINITRRIGSSVQNLSNKLFNGYVFNMSLDVGYNGEASTLTLNLALNKTLNQVKLNSSVISDRKADIKRVKSLVASQKTTPQNFVGNLGNAGAGTYLGTQNEIAKISDKDFNIDPNYIGVTCSYDIGIYNELGVPSYEFKNFKITSFSISKKNDQKILTLTLKDNSFVLDKIFVGLLGQQVALDERSEADALVSGIKISCPQVGTTCAAGSVTLDNLRQTLHFSNENLKDKFFEKVSSLASSLKINSDDSSSSETKANYITITSSSPNKTIFKGYGAVIILGEEEFKDAPCSPAEVSYSFDSLLKAVKSLGIKIVENETPANFNPNKSSDINFDSLRDKSNGKLKKSYHGTLKQVLNQWCEDYAFSYCIDFTKTNSTSFTLKGIDLSSSLSKEAVLSAKLELEDLEASANNSSFVIKSQDFSYDLSQQQLKLYSSFYFKDAKEKSIVYENDLGNIDFYNINLASQFPQLFGSKPKDLIPVRDFSGSYRTYEQVIMSSILGKHSPRLREIYNYSIGAFEALGFIPFYGDPSLSQVALSNDNTLLYTEAISQVLEIQSQNLFSEDDATPNYNIHLGFFNDELSRAVLSMESFIADFIGRYYWSDPLEIADGEYGNEDFYGKYELTTTAPVQKVLVGQLYNLDVFKQARYLLNSISAVFSTGTTQYFEAYRSLSDAAANINNICNLAKDAFAQMQGNSYTLRKYRFFYERSSAAYGVYQEFINDITNLKISIAGDTTAAPQNVDLSDIYSPVFKELSPVSLGLLQSVLPINLQNVALGSFKFGTLIGVNQRRQIFSFKSSANQANPIEVQNSIYSRCSEILRINSSGAQSTVAKNQKTCSKTLLYETCIKPCEQSQTNSGNDDSIDFASGPNPYSCFKVLILRNNSAFLDNYVLGQIFRSSTINGNLSLEAFVDPSKHQSLLVQSLRAPGNISYSKFKTTSQYESIVAPSQNTYKIRLISKTSSQIFLPFRNYVLGGLESADDLLKIINNENFSVSLEVNNITPNVRELFGDETNPSFVNAPVDLSKVANYPVFIDYQGYNGDNPSYEFNTFNGFHSALKTYYDSSVKSLTQPNIKFTVDIFCSDIPQGLQKLLTVDKGLTKLTINLAENGLSLNCSFESYPKTMENLETLIRKNKPNIKLLNTNYFQ